MAFCRNCGTELEDGNKFCTKCGTPVDQAAAPAAASGADAPSAAPPQTPVAPPAPVASPAAPPPPAPKSNKGLWIALVVAILIIAVACVLVFVVFHDQLFGEEESAATGPEKAVQTFFTAMENKDANALFSLIDPDSYQQELAITQNPRTGTPVVLPVTGEDKKGSH